MNIINVTVRGKIARAEGRARVVCGNSDYTVRFDFDEEWAEYFVKTARFVTEDGNYTDVQFEGDTCTIPILRNTRTLLVGVFAGNLRTTTAALIHAVPCITDPDGTPADPTPDVYAQLMERFNAMEAPAAVLYTPQELTDEQKAKARENIGVATPDWNQNDATAADYVKNRTHYTESVYGIVGVGYDGWAKVTKYAAVPITKMAVLGVIYKNVPVAAENDAVVEYVVGDHRLSFDRQYNIMTATPNNIVDRDVTFYGYQMTAVHKLPIIYIPDEVALTKNLPQSDWNEVNSSSASYIKNKPSPSDVTPSASGTASAGKSRDYARADHVHPSELPEYSDADAGKVLTVAGKADVQWQLPSAGADTSLNITGATVGQIAKITAVDDSGKPTAWKAVDMPSGGEQWEKIAEIDFDVDAANDVFVWEYQNLPNYKELAYRKVSLTGSTENRTGLSISINGSQSLPSSIEYSQNGGQSNGWGKILLLPFGWIHVNSGSANGPTNYAAGGVQTAYNAIPFDGDSITSVRLKSHPIYKIAGGKLSLYGRK